MGGCCGSSTPDNSVWEVTMKDGSKTSVIGEQNAHLEQVKNPGSTIRKKS